MNFELTEDQKLLQQTVREFAQHEIAPHAAKLDELSEFPYEHVKKMAELGLMGMMVPPELGGGGMDNLSYVLALEELSAACASTAVTMSVNNSLYCGCLLSSANEAQKKKYIPDWASGKKLGAYALSEPGTGSDAANQKTTASKQGNKYLLNGTKNFITNGPQADAMIVFAMTDKEKRHKGISAFIVEKNFSGFNVGKVEKKMGIRASSTSEIVFKNCEVPVENRLGEEGDGFKIAMTTLDGGRIGIATQALGIARAAFETAAKYSTQREAFGQTISQFQGIQWKLADMAMNIDAARLLIHRAAWMKARGERVTKQAAMAKLFASEMAMNVTKDAIQVLGGYGYCREYPVERYFRDAKITEIYEGTSEIQRIVIAREVLKEITS
ncbi:MAG: acyl-CoA dehydrogenase [Deltaproteobacteria bacterium RIFCSPLOWO2_02_FULL_44_10]|nr:MAG: acyl-CoA dehydrogenase [Deltaproteobacteria bacterium RIFCSPHIGHO2_02_FULL_44_16]OGQ46387.1 MAG: acyl-CoA dehydrogenase [Deltaproteobacteria bacterium RIFCSPLOWO2_02_FULL_44_10]